MRTPRTDIRGNFRARNCLPPNSYADIGEGTVEAARFALRRCKTAINRAEEEIRAIAEAYFHGRQMPGKPREAANIRHHNCFNARRIFGLMRKYCRNAIHVVGAGIISGVLRVQMDIRFLPPEQERGIRAPVERETIG